MRKRGPSFHQSQGNMSTAFDVFLAPEALRINRARQEHLATLGLDLQNKRVLEVGAGIGLHTGFFEERGCDILSTEGSPANVAEMLRRYPQRRIGLLDLDRPGDLTGLGSFDVVYCYGTLYHLRYPDRALAALATVCTGMILLETCVLPGNYPEVQLITEPLVPNQALLGVGCRPTRPWVMAALKNHFGHAYTTLDQPDYPDFIGDWGVVNKDGNLRAVFVGSKQPLTAMGLTETLPMRHRNAPLRTIRRRPSRIWIDVGAHHGEHSIAAAANDPSLMVHAFEPRPTLHDKLMHSAPPNFTAHAMAVSDHDGVASFRINSFDAASSVLPMDEAALPARLGGHRPGDEREILVPTIRLDSFMRENGITKVEFLKIDAQGADFSVVRSLGDRIGDVKRIQFEVIPKADQLYCGAADKATIIAYMAERGFVLEPTEVQSHGQEENLTFARPSSPDQVAAPPEDRGEDASGLYDLQSFEIAAGTVQLSDDRLEITTTPEQWAYTAVIPVERTRAPKGSIVRLILALEVDAGALQAGILNEAETDFITTATLGVGARQTIDLVIPRFDRVGRLVLRNASAGGSSHGWCRLLGITTETPPKLESETETSVGYSSFLATQIRASAIALVGKNADDIESPTVLAEIGEAAERLRPLLSRGGLALIHSNAAAIEAVFAGLDAQILGVLADHLKILLPLRHMPDWNFGEFQSRADLATLVRHALWRTLHRLPLAPTVALPWHGGTTFASCFDNDLSLAMFVGGTYEPNEFALLDRLLRPGMNIIDGGANEGAYTVFFASRVGSTGRVIAVEPSPRELERLRRNIARNSLDNVVVAAAALAERTGEVTLNVANATHAGQNTLGEFMYEGVVSAGRVAVPASTLDELVAAHVPDGKLDVVKLDLEGAELRALAGARNTLRQARPLILFEASPAALARQGGSVEAVTSLLAEAGYRLLCLDPSTGLPVPYGKEVSSDNLLAVHRDRDCGLPTG
ncbi:methyltransferase, FkbM family [Rhizobiales bacterium GAS188]|nr:methyltransferase, FkbM family [Rhizobiales bacterium GAS188]